MSFDLNEYKNRTKYDDSSVEIKQRLEFRLNQLGLEVGDVFEILINVEDKKHNFFCEVIKEVWGGDSWCARRWKDIRVIERGTIFSVKTNINDDTLKGLIDSYAKSIMISAKYEVRKLSQSEANCLKL